MIEFVLGLGLVVLLPVALLFAVLWGAVHLVNKVRRP
jgi:hypothetical protein